nr:hypothetical protein [Tanacetum cinerariifolium]
MKLLMSMTKGGCRTGMANITAANEFPA